MPSAGSFWTVLPRDARTALGRRGVQDRRVVPRSGPRSGARFAASEWDLSGSCTDAGLAWISPCRVLRLAGRRNPGQRPALPSIYCGDGSRPRGRAGATIAPPTPTPRTRSAHRLHARPLRRRHRGSRCGRKPAERRASTRPARPASAASASRDRFSGPLDFTVARGRPRRRRPTTTSRAGSASPPTFGINNGTQGNFNPGAAAPRGRLPATVNGRTYALSYRYCLRRRDGPELAGSDRALRPHRAGPGLRGEIDCDSGQLRRRLTVRRRLGSSARTAPTLTVSAGATTQAPARRSSRVHRDASADARRQRRLARTPTTPPTPPIVDRVHDRGRGAPSEPRQARRADGRDAHRQAVRLRPWVQNGPASIAAPNLNMDVTYRSWERSTSRRSLRKLNELSELPRATWPEELGTAAVRQRRRRRAGVAT